jgi:hypothetical protein
MQKSVKLNDGIAGEGRNDTAQTITCTPPFFLNIHQLPGTTAPPGTAIPGARMPVAAPPLGGVLPGAAGRLRARPVVDCFIYFILFAPLLTVEGGERGTHTDGPDACLQQRAPPPTGGSRKLATIPGE